MAVRLARRGFRVRLVAPTADDAAGRILAEHLAAESIDVRALPATRTAIVVALVGGGERAMASDRVALEGDLAGGLRGADWVHVSGYALRERLEAERVVAGVLAAGIERTSVGGGSFADAEDASVARAAIAALSPGLLVVSLDEADRLAGGTTAASAAEAAARLATAGGIVVVTDGRAGSSAAGGPLAGPVTVPAADASDATDATGAGDAYMAALLVDLAPAWPPRDDRIVRAMRDASAAGAAAAQVAGAQGRLLGEPSSSRLNAAAGQTR